MTLSAPHISDKIVIKPIGDLTPYAGNARTHSAKQLGQLSKSIKRFGFTNPVLIDEAGMILAGHGRVAAARSLGWLEVPCVGISSLSTAEKRAYILADNKLALNAGWDEEVLAQELRYLVEEEACLDLELTGFSISEIDEVLDIGGTSPAQEAEEDNHIPQGPADAAPVSRAGDVWVLGRHRLICGDALCKETYARLMGSEVAQMVFTDPPYNVPIKGHVLGRGSELYREFAMASGEMDPEAFTSFLRTSFEHLAAFSAEGSIHFVCMDWRHMEEVLSAGRSVYQTLKNLCVWVKDNGGMGTFYRSRHELVFVFKKGVGSHINSFELGQYGRYRTNVWSYPEVSSGGKEAREARALHPTVKPVAMVADALKDCSRPGGVILDAFGGSGSTLIAAEKTNRHARLIEFDAGYCDTIVRRWQVFAHGAAHLEGSGRAFDER
ncbi:UNVERIFIED_CONTAM: hypothetical protein GTU68_049136 [Idotea baltica]|nr:hypothetical protein [Idotea baltica]